jgi:hypothetical protein
MYMSHYGTEYGKKSLTYVVVARKILEYLGQEFSIYL